MSPLAWNLHFNSVLPLAPLSWQMNATVCRLSPGLGEPLMPPSVVYVFWSVLPTSFFFGWTNSFLLRPTLLLFSFLCAPVSLEKTLPPFAPYPSFPPACFGGAGRDVGFPPPFQPLKPA